MEGNVRVAFRTKHKTAALTGLPRVAFVGNLSTRRAWNNRALGEPIWLQWQCVEPEGKRTRVHEFPSAHFSVHGL